MRRPSLEGRPTFLVASVVLLQDCPQMLLADLHRPSVLARQLHGSANLGASVRCVRWGPGSRRRRGSMAADSIIDDFAQRLALVIDALREQFTGAWRPQTTVPLMLFADVGKPGVREGELVGVGSFVLHGCGCRVVAHDGAVIDFDWDASGQEIVDGWRILTFAESVGVADYDRNVLASAAQRSKRFVEVHDRDGWFALR